MARKKFRGTLLACSLLAFGAVSLGTIGLTSCQKQDVKGVLNGVTGFSISNKDEFAKEWKAGDGNRIIEFSWEGNTEINATQAVNDGAIEITSSDDSVASPLGLYIVAKKEGTVKITVTVHTDKGDLTDTIDLVIDKAMVAPEPTKATVKELLAMNVKDWQATIPQPIYEVTAVVGDWYGKVGSGYGPVSEPGSYGNWYMYDESDPSTQILVYGGTVHEEALTFNLDGTWTYTDQKDFVADDGSTPFVKGDTITMNVILAEYNGVTQLKGVVTNIVPGVQIPYESVTLECDKETIKIGEYATLTREALPADANVGELSYEITEGKDLVEIKENKVYGRKAGKVTIVAHAGDVSSEPITLNVSATEISYGTVKQAYEAGKGKEVAFAGKLLSVYGTPTQHYGIYVGDGDHAILLYGAKAPTGAEIGDTLKVTGKTDIYKGLFQIANADVVLSTRSVGTMPAVVELTSLDGIDGQDASKQARVKGTVSDHSIDSYGNVVFNVNVDENTKVNVKADSRYVPSYELVELEALKDGDTVSILGLITFTGTDDENGGLPTNADYLQVINPIVEHETDNAKSIADVYELAAGTPVKVYGQYMGEFAGKEEYGIYVADGEHALFVYGGKAPEGTKVGDAIKVMGETDIYNGGLQIAKNSVITEYKGNDIATPVALTIDTLEGIDGKDTAREATVSGTVSEHNVDKYDNVTFVVTTAGGAAVKVKADSRYVPEAEVAKLKEVKDGDTVTIKGNVTFNVKDLETLPTDANGLEIHNIRLA